MSLEGCSKHTDAPLENNQEEQNDVLETTPETESEEVLTLLAKKYDIDESSITLLQKKKEKTLMRGEYVINGKQKIFLAAQISGEWRLVASDESEINCESINLYGFSSGMVPECKEMDESVNAEGELPVEEGITEEEIDSQATVFCDALTPCQTGICVVLPEKEIPTCVPDEATACASCDAKAECTILESYPPQVRCISNSDENDSEENSVLENSEADVSTESSLGEIAP